MSDERKGLPSPGTANFDIRMRETLMTYLGQQGNKLDRGVTVRDLVDSGIVALRPGFLNGGGTVAPIGGPGPNVGAEEVDLTPPPTPTGFVASAAISNIFVECAAQLYRQGHGHAQSVLYGVSVPSGAPLPTFANAVELTRFSGTVFAYATNPSTTWRLWLKWRTADGVLSIDPAGGINGVAITTGQDVTKMVQAMTGAGNPFTILAADTVIGGVSFSAGTYSTRSFIVDLQVTNAKLANLAVDDAKVANMSASKLTAGAIAVGQYIQSTGYAAGLTGWRIEGNGNAEFSNVTVRGTVYATAGQIAGNLIVTGSLGAINANLGDITSGNLTIYHDGTLGGGYGGIKSVGKSLNDGVDGWTFQRNNAGDTFVDMKAGACGMMMHGADSYFRLYAPGIEMTNGGLTINQLNVIDTFNIKNEAVSTPAYISTPGSDVSLPYVLPRQALVFVMAGMTMATANTGIYLDINGAEVWSAICRDGVPAAMGYAVVLPAGRHMMRVRSGAANYNAFLYVLATYK